MCQQRVLFKPKILFRVFNFGYIHDITAPSCLRTGSYEEDSSFCPSSCMGNVSSNYSSLCPILDAVHLSDLLLNELSHDCCRS